MIKSMTGFGKGKAPYGGGQIRIEIKTYNHKFYELTSKLPESLQAYEERVKKMIRKSVQRGKVYLWINYENLKDSGTGMEVDRDKLRHYYGMLKEIQKEFSLSGDITLSQLLSFPDILVYKAVPRNTQKLWSATNRALNSALKSLLLMREREGKLLKRDMEARAANIARSLRKLKKLIPQEIQSFERRLRQKTAKISDKNGTRAERIQAEVAMFAKNCDVSEEIARLEAHIENFLKSLKSEKEAGKILDFIAQEIQREINTLGAKSSDFRISREVIYVKGEVEKIREQVQNIE